MESGVVEVDAYIEGVAALIDRYGVDRYFAHRKESENKLAAIGRTGAEIVRPMLPLELVARRGPVGRRIISFPSTVVHTLPLVVERADVEIVLCAIPDDWYAPETTQRADDFLVEVTSSPTFGTAWPPPDRTAMKDSLQKSPGTVAVIPARGGSKGVPGRTCAGSVAAR